MPKVETMDTVPSMIAYQGSVYTYVRYTHMPETALRPTLAMLEAARRSDYPTYIQHAKMLIIESVVSIDIQNPFMTIADCMNTFVDPLIAELGRNLIAEYRQDLFQ